MTYLHFESHHTARLAADTLMFEALHFFVISKVWPSDGLASPSRTARYFGAWRYIAQRACSCLRNVVAKYELQIFYQI